MPWLDEAFAALRHLRPSFIFGLVALGILISACTVAKSGDARGPTIELSRGR